LKKRIIEKLTNTALFLEILLTVFLAIGIAIGLVDIVKYFVHISKASAVDSYGVFKQFLAHILLIVVGVEFMLMLISHSINSMLELILFVIARKMLIYADTMLDLVLGTIAIAILFIILKYLPVRSGDDYGDDGGAIYSASTTISRLIEQTGIKLPKDKGRTLGGLTFNLAEESTKPITEGSEFILGNIKLKVLKVTDGLIEKVAIEEISDDKDAKIEVDS